MRRRAFVVGVAGLGLFGSARVVDAVLGDRQRAADPLWTASDSPESSARAQCVDGASLPSHGSVGGAQLVYEVDGGATTMRFDPTFHQRLEAWFADWQQTNPYGKADQLWSQGAFFSKDECKSWHAAGRALDVARLKRGDDLLVTCRRDRWQGLSQADLETWERRYWCLAASLNLHFEHVLTHLFDELHETHIHVDNGASGSSMSVFRSSSRVQNQSVQAICRTLWGIEGEPTGLWSDTQRMVEPVLREIGAGDLRERRHWQAFLRASVQRG